MWASIFIKLEMGGEVRELLVMTSLRHDIYFHNAIFPTVDAISLGPWWVLKLFLAISSVTYLMVSSRNASEEPKFAYILLYSLWGSFLSSPCYRFEWGRRYIT